jgi:NADH-quinone oxidoreductase subunit F
MDDSHCIVDIAESFMRFFVRESCGKCVPCRIGTTRLHDIVKKIAHGDGTYEDLRVLKDLGRTMQQTALCGLGQSAPIPVMTMLRYFGDEFEAHIKEKRCPTGVCRM